MLRSISCAFVVLFCCSSIEAEEKSVEELTAQARKSVVVLTVGGRDRQQSGVGTGFVVGKGLIATNLHVVGRGRAITVETVDGKKHPVIAVHASDRSKDLAIVQIKDESLVPLPLGDSKKIRDGQKVVALGNPLGLKHSVVSGVLSGSREIEGRSMLQVAIPVERGNSGGPLLDGEGQVIGVMTMKSMVTKNLGFAMGVNALKPLLSRPNPVAMSAWLTIGALDREEWESKLGAQWRQRAGRIIVEGMGNGFGGRSFCLSKEKVPELPFEASVTVKLDNESGAAGLIFHADETDRHYGFYPSGGGLRLTRFDGPNVFTWQILSQTSSSHYRPGQWNTLKVRLAKDGIQCFVNGHLVVESKDKTYTSGRVGLAKFRNTVAEFKHFQVAKKIEPLVVGEEASARIQKLLEKIGTSKASSKQIESLSREGAIGIVALRAEAKKLEEQAKRLKQMALKVHERHIQQELQKVFGQKEDAINLVHASLLIARLDNDEVDVPVYLRQVDRMALKAKSMLPKDADDAARLKVLNEYLFRQRGFHGSRGDYYHRSNSYLNEVLDDREGLPITLSIVYMEVGRRLGLQLEGVGLPGHFVVRHRPKKGKPQLIDVFEGGKILSREEAARKVEGITGRPFEESHLEAVSKRDMIVRGLNNLLIIAQDEEQFEDMLKYLNTMIAIAPDMPAERGMRAAVLFQLKEYRAALADLDWLLENKPKGLDLNRARLFRRRIESEISD